MAEKRTDIAPAYPKGGLAHTELPARDPFGVLQRVAEEMDRVFDDFGFGGNWLTPRFGRRFPKSAPRAAETEYLWAPDIDIFQRKDEIVVRADLPGLSKDEIKVEVGEDAVTVYGERTRSDEEKREGFYRAERSYGSFYRVIPLPKGAITDHAKAIFKDGVLEVTIPAPPEHETRGRRLDISEGKK